MPHRESSTTWASAARYPALAEANDDGLAHLRRLRQILTHEARRLYVNEPLGMELDHTGYALDATTIIWITDAKLADVRILDVLIRSRAPSTGNDTRIEFISDMPVCFPYPRSRAAPYLGVSCRRQARGVDDVIPSPACVTGASMSESHQERLRKEMAEHYARLNELEAERTAVQKRLAELDGELRNAGRSSGQLRVLHAPGAPRSKQEKVALFRSLFAGRGDIYPKLWRNPRTKKQGYAPACANEWIDGVCEKPRIKCGECPNQAFLKVADQVILDHLQGRHVIGVYPLLGDERCWFVAVDFDKKDWQEDVSAYATTARRFGLTPAVERSRSGNGAHVWFFFAAPVSATDGRKMASYMLTETMASRPAMPMSSYDRLFPNQDTMPRGGFGNLIALPLQYEARQSGNTVFVDPEWQPIPDQWAYLAALPRIDPGTVRELAREASVGDRELGVRRAPSEDEARGPPWLRLPSRREPDPTMDRPLPSVVMVVIAQQVFIEKASLPPALIAQIKRLAAFQNPRFYEKQAMRLSTALTPRVIDCAEDLPEHIGMPRGCLDDLRDLLDRYGAKLVVDDLRLDGERLEVQFHGELTQLQERAAAAMAAHQTGVLSAPPGTGKTVVGAYLVAHRARNTLIIVHRAQLVDQWRAQLGMFLDLKPASIGRIGGGKRKVTGTLDVAMIQSLTRGGKVDDVVATYGHVIVDECHHVPAVSFERVMREVKARYVTGLTATPHRRDGHHPILTFQLGPVRHVVDPRRQAARRPFEHLLLARETSFHLGVTEGAPGIQEIYGRLASDEARNNLILDDVIRALEDGRSPIVLTERRDHLDYLAERLERVARNLVILRGGLGEKRRRETMEKLAAVSATEERLVLATGRFIGEGFDDARLDTLFLTMPVAWKGTLVQYAGRLHRARHGKTDVRIYDYVDRDVPMLARMFKKRLKGYRAMGYRITDAPTGDVHDLTIEYDDEVKRSWDTGSA